MLTPVQTEEPAALGQNIQLGIAKGIAVGIRNGFNGSIKCVHIYTYVDNLADAHLGNSINP
jgi:hypothetical protein